MEKKKYIEMFGSFTYPFKDSMPRIFFIVNWKLGLDLLADFRYSSRMCPREILHQQQQNRKDHVHRKQVVYAGIQWAQIE